MIAMRQLTVTVAAVVLAGAAASRPSLDAGPMAAEPPRQLVPADSAVGTGRTVTVPAGGDVQAAVDAARPGDTIVLVAGATYRGPITLPAKTGEGWLTIRSSLADELPSGQRVTPVDAPRMAQIVSARASDPAVRTAAGAHHVRLVGLELTVAPGTYNTGLVVLGSGEETSDAQFPHHLVIERCYIHGDPQSGGKRGIALNARHVAIVDSYFTDWKGVGQEAQAIAGWNGPGPFKIVNNHIEAAGVNVLYGGADPTITNLVPADIEVRRNHFTKPLGWRDKNWVVKNLFELKNARRVLVDGNVFEHSWAAAQAGFAVLLTPRNQDGRAPWSVVEDVTFVNNVVRGAGSGISIYGRDNNHPSGQTRRIHIANNLFADIDAKTWGGRGWLFMILDGARDITIEHNTGFPSGAVIGAEAPPHLGFVFRNNIVAHGEYGVKGSGLSGGEPTLRALFPDASVSGNVFIGPEVASFRSGNPTARRVKDVGFVDPDRGDWRLASSSRFKGAAGGRDPGADLDGIARATGLGERLVQGRARGDAGR
jgi:hypothetical protein